MRYFIIISLIVLKLIFFCESGIINFIYFDPSTTISSNKQDGVVVLELTNGTKSTICMTNVNDNNNANVICKMLKYTGGTFNNGVAVISSVTSNIGSALFQNLACVGTETTIENCNNFVTSSNVFTCNNHNQDLHVMCYGSYEYAKTTMSINTCIGSLTAGNQGWLTVKENSITAYFCSINRNFGPSEAEYFCKNTLCSNTIYSRIVEGYQSTSNRMIGGFNNMSCNATDCINVYPYQSDRCTPDSNIGVTCTNDTSVMYPSPSIFCANTFMTISWDSNTYNATIANNYFAILYANGSNCTSISVNSSVTATVNLTVAYSSCDMIVDGTNESIYFIFRVKRMYPKVGNIIIYPDETFNVSCVIQRNQTVVQGPINVLPVALPPSSGTSLIPNTLTLFTDSGFTNQIPNLEAVAIGSRIFALVQLVNPPPDILLVLVQCSYGVPQILLINNRCPVLSTVGINPINDTAKSFNFIFNQPTPSSSTAEVKCLTSKCSKGESGCLTTC